MCSDWRPGENVWTQKRTRGTDIADGGREGEGEWREIKRIRRRAEEA